MKCFRTTVSFCGTDASSQRKKTTTTLDFHHTFRSDISNDSANLARQFVGVTVPILQIKKTQRLKPDLTLLKPQLLSPKLLLQEFFQHTFYFLQRTGWKRSLADMSIHSSSTIGTDFSVNNIITAAR